MNLPNNTLLQGGKYKIVRFISNGGFGCTYEAEHTMLHKRVAIKEFFVKDFCNRDEQTSHVTVGTQTKVALVSKLRKKFVEEAVALSQFQHENIVRVSDVFEENGTAYYVMDFVNGRSLHEILKTESTIPESRAVKYICQVAHALRYVHAQNRLHLDIKPGNIMIDDRDNAVLIDFGTSKQYDEEAGENTSTLLGKTPGYAPIEQMGNSVQNFTPATDIYSLGATLYKMLTGITPPEANLLVSDDEALKPLPTYITPATRKAVEQAMQVKRKDRPQSIDELLDVWGLPEYTKDEQPMSEDSDESTLLIESDKTSSPETIPQTPETLEASPNKPNKKKSLIGIVATASILLLIVFIVCLSGNGKVEDEEPLLADTISIIEQPITVTDEIDLGLSVLWHSKNISADKGSENGTFYGYKDIKDANNNIVTNTLGNGWRIPTRKEWEELLTECSWEWTGDGYEVAASNGNKIFLPALGLNYKGNSLVELNC